MSGDWEAPLAEHAMLRAREWAAFRIKTLTEYVKEYTESPIERILLAKLFCALDMTSPGTPCHFQAARRASWTWEDHEEYVGLLVDFDLGGGNFSSTSIGTQVGIGPYRADIFISCVVETRGERKRLRLVVECDGHDHHDLTKDQARRDRQRDRWMLANGFAILRFTGSEIFNDPFRCADEIHKFVDSWIEKVIEWPES